MYLANGGATWRRSDHQRQRDEGNDRRKSHPRDRGGIWLRIRHVSQESIRAGGQRFSVCVGRDSRVSGPMLASALAAGLCAVGVDVIDLGIVTTPGVGIMVRELGCDGGIVITASHNPIPYNGIKLLLGNGMAPPPATAGQIQQVYLDGRTEYIDSIQCGTVIRNGRDRPRSCRQGPGDHRCPADRRQTYRIVLDSINGAGRESPRNCWRSLAARSWRSTMSRPACSPTSPSRRRRIWPVCAGG